MSEKEIGSKEIRSEIISAGFEIHFDGEAVSFVLWAKDASELNEVKKIAESFKGVKKEVVG